MEILVSVQKLENQDENHSNVTQQAIDDASVGKMVFNSHNVSSTELAVLITDGYAFTPILKKISQNSCTGFDTVVIQLDADFDLEKVVMKSLEKDQISLIYPAFGYEQLGGCLTLVFNLPNNIQILPNQFSAFDISEIYSSLTREIAMTLGISKYVKTIVTHPSDITIGSSLEVIRKYSLLVHIDDDAQIDINLFNRVIISHMKNHKDNPLSLCSRTNNTEN